jgi:phosphopentomutase
MARTVLVIIDGLGCGSQEDSHLYGDVGCNTLGHVVNRCRTRLPNLGRMGLGNIVPLDTVPPVAGPGASWGKLREVSAGKDSTTGHWEIAGVTLQTPFPTYPNGFPPEVIDAFCKVSGVDGILANGAWSGTDVIERFGGEHLATGRPIVYTSADSVFQIAAHESVTPIETLYRWCELSRTQVMTGEHLVGRVIARPFTGSEGAFTRLNDHRKDYSAIPPKPNLPEHLLENGIKTFSIGKVIDLFAGVGFSQYRKTKNNAEGIAQLLNALNGVEDGFIFVNLIDTDQLFGHRNDPDGYSGSLEEFDRALPAILAKLRPDDVLMITGDHGNDPTTPGSDHTREFVPILVYPAHRCVAVDLGTRASFRDIAASVNHSFGLPDIFGADAFISGK